MSMIDRDWYKDHHQGRKFKRYQTLDKDPRETPVLDEPSTQTEPKSFRLSLFHFVLICLLVITSIIRYFSS